MSSRTVLITGANRGIGLALTRTFGRAGWRVIAGCRNPEAAEQLKEEAQRYTIEPEALDVSDPGSIAGFAERTNQSAIDVLINNAGVFHQTGPFAAFDRSEWQSSMEVNVFGPVQLSLALLPALRAGHDRKIVSISSALGSIALTTGSTYAYRCSKAALNMAMRSLAMDLAEDQFTVVSISPGLVNTELVRDIPRDKISPEESAQAMFNLISALRTSDTGKFFKYSGPELAW